MGPQQAREDVAVGAAGGAVQGGQQRYGVQGGLQRVGGALGRQTPHPRLRPCEGRSSPLSAAPPCVKQGLGFRVYLASNSATGSSASVDGRLLATATAFEHQASCRSCGADVGGMHTVEQVQVPC